MGHLLNHLRQANQLRHVTGIVFGDPTANIKPHDLPLLESACLHALQDFPGPIAIAYNPAITSKPEPFEPLGT